MCRSQAREPQRSQALTISLYALNVITQFIALKKTKKMPEIPPRIMELMEGKYRNYCASSIFHFKDHDKDREEILRLMTDPMKNSTAENDQVIKWWHKIQETAHHFTVFNLPTPDLSRLFSSKKSGSPG